MRQYELPGYHGRTVGIDLCEPCQAFWFDTHEIRQLREARGTPIDPALPLNLARARADVEAALKGLPREREWFADVAEAGLIGAGLHLVAGWFTHGA